MSGPTGNGEIESFSTKAAFTDTLKSLAHKGSHRTSAVEASELSANYEFRNRSIALPTSVDSRSDQLMAAAILPQSSLSKLEI
jgi:hypothetical protein